MANQSITIFRQGDVRFQDWKIDSTLTYEPGMLLFDAGSQVAKPSNSFTWDTNLATTQAGFADKFIGICWSYHDPLSPAGSPQRIERVAVDTSSTSVYEYPVVSSANYIMGDKLAANGAASALTAGSKTLVEATADAGAIARVCEVVTGTVTKVRCTFSPYQTTSSNAAAGAIG